MSKDKRVISHDDAQLLSRLARLAADRARTAHDEDAWLAEQARQVVREARIVDQEDCPTDVVSVGAPIVYEDAASGQRRTLVLVEPHYADVDGGLVPLLSPVGCALLGRRKGSEVQVPSSTGAVQDALRVLLVGPRIGSNRPLIVARWRHEQPWSRG